MRGIRVLVPTRTTGKPRALRPSSVLALTLMEFGFTLRTSAANSGVSTSAVILARPASVTS
jgi:hypothetical protein